MCSATVKSGVVYKLLHFHLILASFTYYYIRILFVQTALVRREINQLLDLSSLLSHLHMNTSIVKKVNSCHVVEDSH